MERIIVPIDEQLREFDDFLNQKDNHRILFSGAFGSGKTYFLQKYFEQKDNCEVFYISPVNYCISRNEDIVKILQYDLLVEIMFKKLLPESEEQFSKWTTNNYFIYFNLLNIIKTVISHCGAIGKKTSDICDSYLDWSKKYYEFSKTVNGTQTDEVINLAQELAEKYEFDPQTELINEIVSDINKKSVLIIDDLDRIDPEHIFRLLNVFSAQLSGYFNSHSFNDVDKNKFGFDKIIFVCDIDNLRNIFHAKYGQNTDFSGYIDKFYSTQPYLWNNRHQIFKVVSQYVNSVRMELGKEQRDILLLLTKLLVHYDIINLRKLVEKERQEWIWSYRNNPTPFVYSIEITDFVLFLFGTESETISVLSKYQEEIDIVDINEKTRIRLFDHLLPFLDDNFLSTNHDEKVIRKYSNQNWDIVIEYEVCVYAPSKYTSIIKITNYDGKEKTKIPFFQMLGVAVVNYCKFLKAREVIRY